jgi:hypothetical protein
MHRVEPQGGDGQHAPRAPADVEVGFGGRGDHVVDHDSAIKVSGSAEFVVWADLYAHDGLFGPPPHRGFAAPHRMGGVQPLITLQAKQHINLRECAQKK